MDELVMEVPGAFSPEFCEVLIDKFEKEGKAKEPGRIGPQGEICPEIRDSLNLEMHLNKNWAVIVENIREVLFKEVQDYLDDIHTEFTGSLYAGGYDANYTIMKYSPGSVGYDWHNDFMLDDIHRKGGVRTITWMIYLNECEGGETEFKFGKKIKPETGKVVFFPSTWCMIHRGCPVISGSKYLCVGWFYSMWNLTPGLCDEIPKA